MSFDFNMKIIQNRCQKCNKLHSLPYAFCSIECAERLHFQGTILTNVVFT